jgi:hypothetical protein
MWWVSAESTRSAFASKITMSASEPGAMVPLRGYRPNILAGAVATSSTKRLRPMWPASTPPYSSVNRSSTEGSPFGILEKSPLPRSF